MHAGVHAGVHAEVHADLTDREAAMLRACVDDAATSKDLQAAAEYAGRTRSFQRHLNGLLRKGLLKMAVPDKPRSPAQRYLLTDKGRAAIPPNE